MTPKDAVKIEPYVTAKGGVVILNGPFPFHDAEKVRALCAASPKLLSCLKKMLAWSESEDLMPDGLEDEVRSAIKEAEVKP